MSLPRRLAISFSIILLLSLSSILVHTWGNNIRKDKLSTLRQVILTQSAVAEFRQQLNAVNQTLGVIDTLRNAGEANIDELALYDIQQRLAKVRTSASRIEERLALYLDPFRAQRQRLNAGPLFDDWEKFLAGEKPHPMPSGRRNTGFDFVESRLGRIENLLLSETQLLNTQLEKVVALTNRATIAVFVSALLITFALAYHLTQYTRRSISGLQEGTQQWGAGNLDYKVDVLGKDELSELARSFNAMAGNLKTAMTDARESETRAETANRAKSQFLANMSHELRTPMNAIIGYSEMMLEDIEDTKNLKANDLSPDIAKIQSSGQHLLSLINDILDISKVESGKMEIILEETNLRDLLDDVMGSVVPQIEANNSEFRFDYNVNLEIFRADLTKFKQIIINLLSNAAKFTKNGRIWLSVDEAIVDHQRMLQFRVADTGVGMSEDQAKRVFDAFVQADSSTTRQFGGTGLGLTISRRFAELMHGSLTVKSELGRGSVFTFSLPYELVNPIPQASFDHDRSKRARVLVIDDDPVAIDLTQRILSRENIEVIVADGGRKGLEMARKELPDAIVLDAMMPEVDGQEVLRALRDDPLTADIRVLMQSMLDYSDVAELAGNAGADDFLIKPIVRDTLASAVNSLLPRDGAPSMLLLEPDDKLRNLVAQAAGNRWHIHHMNDPQSALKKLSQGNYDVLVMGVYDRSPAMAGFAETLDNDITLKNIPVIRLQSGHTSEKLKAQLDDIQISA